MKITHLVSRLAVIGHGAIVMALRVVREAAIDRLWGGSRPNRIDRVRASHDFTYPDIGFTTARDQLEGSVFPAYLRFREARTRENGLEVAEATWAIHEKVWHESGCVPDKDQFRAVLFAACPELKLMRDWAETGKHAGLYRKVRLVKITGAGSQGNLVDSCGLFGGRTGPPPCTLAIETVDGKSYNVEATLERVVQFWKSYLVK
jgi:hypothetical protein